MSCTVNVLMMMVLMVSARRDLDQVMELGELLLRSSSMVDNFRVLPCILSLTAAVSTALPSPA